MKNLYKLYPNQSPMHWISHLLAITGVLGMLASIGYEAARKAGFSEGAIV